MEIIKKGNIEQVIETKMFECKRCGCVFKAERSEYESKMDCRNDMYYLCDCPTCGKTVYQSEE
jgi:hypothetical protein